ncbi:MAG: DNA-binding protein, CopG family [Oceanicaulis sp. HLUCCA04]|nr:MAG: DNA-binding protein, CopG family [Oceanicaulis sp. HLUCCA04]
MSAPFIAIVHRDAEDVFGAFFPDVPGCYASGSTLDTLLHDAAHALRAHLDALEDFGKPLPAARSLQAVMEDPALDDDRADAFVIVPVSPLARAGKPKRININVDEFALERIDRAARKAGLSRSRFLVESALQATSER